MYYDCDTTSEIYQRKDSAAESIWTAPVYSMHHILLTGLFSVGEEDEVSIKEVEDMIASALEFTGEIHVSL